MVGRSKSRAKWVKERLLLSLFQNIAMEKDVKGIKVLIIDDKEREAEAIADWLEPLGCVVNAAYSGVEGLTLAKTQHPDVIILDIIMSTEDEGFRVLKELRAVPVTRSIPVVI